MNSSISTVPGRYDVDSPHRDAPYPRARFAPAIPPGFEEEQPTPELQSQTAGDIEYHVRIALLEQELRNINAHLVEARHTNAHLNQLNQDETAKVFEVVRELQRCERRAATSEVAVEYLAELHVQMATKIKENKKPDDRIFDLKDQLQRIKHEGQNKILAMDIDIQNLRSEN